MSGIKGQSSIKSMPTSFEEQEDDIVKVGLEDFSFLQVLGKGSFGKVLHMQLCLITKITFPCI